MSPLEGAWAAWYRRRHEGMPPYSWYVRRWLVEIAAAQTPLRRAARATSPQGEACVIAVRFVEILQESLLPTGGHKGRPYSTLSVVS